MARGFLSGVIAGALVSGLGLGTVSVMTGGVKTPAPQAGGVDVPEGSGFSQPKDDTAAALPGTSDSPDAGEAPKVSAPEPDDLASLSGAATESAAQPETGSAEETLTQPQEGAGEAGVEVGSDSPVLPSPQSAAPEAPQDESELSISADPAQPSAPDVEDTAAFPQDEVAAIAEDSAEQPAMQDVVTAKAGGAEPQEPDVMGTDTPEISDPASMPEIAAGDDAAETPDSTAETGEAETPAADTADAAEGTGDEESTSTIGNLAPEVTTNRLPSVGDTPDEPETATEEAAVAVTDEEPEQESPPLEQFAASFENPGDKPLMSIILIDDGSSPVGLEALQSFPYPLSFAVDSSWSGAARAMASYRAAGFEVLAMIDLPEGAGGQDVEVAMQATLAKLPEVVAVMDGTRSGLQSSRAASDQLAPILLDSGHGAVLFPKGLNTAQKLLEREGVPSASVFRDFDAKGQDATVIRRFLDQAAFKAAQGEDGVVMVGRLRPDTVSALLLWGLQDRANRVSLAPVSAMLLQSE